MDSNKKVKDRLLNLADSLTAAEEEFKSDGLEVDRFYDLLRKINEYFDETMQMLDNIHRGGIVVVVPQEITEKIAKHGS
jgi:hypothetical protein